MSKEKGEGVTFNDIFMFMIAVPLVLLWVGFAGFVIHTGLNNSAVLENIEAYTIKPSSERAEQMKRGMFSGRILTHDLIGKTVTEKQFNYNEHFDQLD